MADIPERGDNFALVGPWRLLAGEAWHGWELAAAEAELKASRAVGDGLGSRRTARRLTLLRKRGPLPVALTGR